MRGIDFAADMVFAVRAGGAMAGWIGRMVDVVDVHDVPCHGHAAHRAAAPPSVDHGAIEVVLFVVDKLPDMLLRQVAAMSILVAIIAPTDRPRPEASVHRHLEKVDLGLQHHVLVGQERHDPVHVGELRGAIGFRSGRYDAGVGEVGAFVEQVQGRQRIVVKVQQQVATLAHAFAKDVAFVVVRQEADREPVVFAAEMERTVRLGVQEFQQQSADSGFVQVQEGRAAAPVASHGPMGIAFVDGFADFIVAFPQAVAVANQGKGAAPGLLAFLGGIAVLAGLEGYGPDIGVEIDPFGTFQGFLGGVKSMRKVQNAALGLGRQVQSALQPTALENTAFASVVTIAQVMLHHHLRAAGREMKPQGVVHKASVAAAVIPVHPHDYAVRSLFLQREAVFAFAGAPGEPQRVGYAQVAGLVPQPVPLAEPYRAAEVEGTRIERPLQASGIDGQTGLSAPYAHRGAPGGGRHPVASRLQDEFASGSRRQDGGGVIEQGKAGTAVLPGGKNAPLRAAIPVLLVDQRQFSCGVPDGTPGQGDAAAQGQSMQRESPRIVECQGNFDAGLLRVHGG